MANPKRKPDETQEPQQILLDDTFNAESLNPALQALYAELGMEGDVDVTVHVSLLPTDGKGLEAGVWKGTPDEYDLETIARQFGSGQYRVKVYVRNPVTGGKPCRGNKLFAWKLSPAQERQRLADAAPKPEMAAQSALTPEKLIETVVAAVKAALPAPQPVQSRSEMLAEMKLMADIFKPAQAPAGNDFMSTLAMFAKFQEVMKGMAPERILDEDGKVDANAILYKGLDIFGDAIKARATAKAVPDTPAPEQSQMPAVIPADAALPVAPANLNADDAAKQELETAMNLLSIQLKVALTLAKANGDPAAFADSIFDMLPDEAINILQNDAGWLDKLAEVNPAVKEYAEWFERLRTEILRLEAEDANQDG